MMSMIITSDKDLAEKDNETSYETDSYEELLEKKII